MRVAVGPHVVANVSAKIEDDEPRNPLALAHPKQELDQPEMGETYRRGATTAIAEHT